MKVFSAMLVLCVALTPLACGEGGSTASEQESGSRFIAAANPPFAAISRAADARPEIDPPDGPSPKKVRIRDLEAGSGPLAKRGDWVAVHYIGFEYETGKQKYPGSWPPYPPREFRLGSGGNGGPFERGIEGMKAGGLRELIVPPSRLYGPGGIDYVIALARIESDSEQAR